MYRNNINYININIIQAKKKNWLDAFFIMIVIAAHILIIVALNNKDNKNKYNNHNIKNIENIKNTNKITPINISLYTNINTNTNIKINKNIKDINKNNDNKKMIHSQKNQQEAKPQAKQEAKQEIKQIAKPIFKPATKQEIKQEIKQELKQINKQINKPDILTAKKVQITPQNINSIIPNTQISANNTMTDVKKPAVTQNNDAHSNQNQEQIQAKKTNIISPNALQTIQNIQNIQLNNNNINNINNINDLNKAASKNENQDQNAAYLGQKNLPYPELARANDEEGEVKLRVQISPSGVATKVEVLNSSGFQRLDNYASNHVKKAKFRPAIKNGSPQSSEINVVISFYLSE